MFSGARIAIYLTIRFDSFGPSSPLLIRVERNPQGHS